MAKTIDPRVTERLARLAVVAKQAEDAFGDPEVARAWLRSENMGLGGCTPLSMLDTDIGSREVAKSWPSPMAARRNAGSRQHKRLRTSGGAHKGLGAYT